MDLIERLINKDYLTERERKEWLGTIKERLEVLEKENIELQLQVEQLEDSAKIRTQQADEYATTLKEKYLDLTQENEKLKKAIEILKRRVISLKGIKDCESATEYNRYTSLGLITQQEYELLKEVLDE